MGKAPKLALRDNVSRSGLLTNWQLWPFLLLAISLFYARFLVSISLGLMGVVAIYQLWLNRKNPDSYSIKSNKFFWLMLVLFGFVLVDGVRTGFAQNWLNEVVLKLPLILVPWYMLSIKYSRNTGEQMMVLLTSMVVITSVLSVGNYIANAAEINALLLQSKHVPVIGGTHHIYFGIFMALSFWLSTYFSLYGKYVWFWRVCAVLILVNLHVLASRTGLVALYAGIPLILLWMWNNVQNKKWVLMIALGCLFLPLLAYFSSSSLKNKVTNSVEDFVTIQKNGDHNYKSFAMRVEAWQMTYRMFIDHPFIGVGGTDFEVKLQQQYQKSNTTLFQENRIGPHNQFLESAAKYGFLALITLILLFVITVSIWKQNPMIVAFMVCFLVSFLLESVLERQLGMICFGVFISYALNYSTLPIE